MEIQLLLPWSEAARQANEVWDTNGFRDQILSDGCKIRYCLNGDKFWYQNDQLHRLDGPACEYSDGYKVWYIKGKHYTEQQFNTHLRGAPCAPNTSNT